MYLTIMLNAILEPDHLSSTLNALADPTRRAVLSRLARGEAMVSELAAPFAISLPAVSRHLRVLESAGLILRGRAAQWRPCRLRPAPLKEVAAWVGQYRQMWEQNLDQLEDYLSDIQAPSPSHPPEV